LKNYPVYEIQKFNCDLVSEEIYVNTFKNHLQNHSFIEKSHSHNFFLLVTFTNGTGQHTIDFETYAISLGTVFFFNLVRFIAGNSQKTLMVIFYFILMLFIIYTLPQNG